LKEQVTPIFKIEEITKQETSSKQAAAKARGLQKCGIV
jgi:hypothetical protein